MTKPSSNYRRSPTIHCVLEMGWYRLQEDQCIMSKVLRYSDASLLKSISGLSILYNHYVTESDKIISLTIDSTLLPSCTRDFIYKMPFWNFYPLQKTLYWSIHNDSSINWCQYLFYSIDTHTETLCITVSSHLYSVCIKLDVNRTEDSEEVLLPTHSWSLLTIAYFWIMS